MFHRYFKMCHIYHNENLLGTISPLNLLLNPPTIMIELSCMVTDAWRCLFWLKKGLIWPKKMTGNVIYMRVADLKRLQGMLYESVWPLVGWKIGMIWQVEDGLVMGSQVPRPSELRNLTRWWVVMSPQCVKVSPALLSVAPRDARGLGVEPT